MFTRSNQKQPSQQPAQHSSWTRIALPAEQQLRRTLQSRHALRLHAWLTAGLTLALMAALSALLLRAGMDRMALRYGLVLSAGYGLYLLLVRIWAEAMLRNLWEVPMHAPSSVPTEVPTGLFGRRDAWSEGPASLEVGQGGSFAGAGASGHWDSAEPASAAVSESLGNLELPGADALDPEGVVWLPVLLVFGLLLLLLSSAGSLLWLIFGSELFLAVAVEVAFALLMARTLFVMEREGWLLVALRLSWKPVLGTLLVTVALGWLCDVLFPQADTLAQVVRALSGA